MIGITSTVIVAGAGIAIGLGLLFTRSTLLKQPVGEADGIVGLLGILGRWNAGLKRKSIHIGEYDIPYLEGGTGDSVLILIHGFGANKDTYAQIAAHLNYRVRLIIPDLPGFGATVKRFDDDFTIDRQADRISRFIDRLGLQLPVHIAGNSMGGYIAGVVVAKYPETIASLWLINPAGAQASRNSEVINHHKRTGENLLTSENGQQVKRLLSFVFYKQPFHLPGFILNAMAARSKVDKALHDRIYNSLGDEKFDLAHRLAVSSYKNPILLMWGDSDRILDVAGAWEMKQLLPEAKLVIMDKMGHCPQMERPKETADEYLKFLYTV